MEPKITSAREFARVWNESRSAADVAAHFGVALRTVMHRRRTTEHELGITLPSLSGRATSPDWWPNWKTVEVAYDKPADVVVSSDWHCWPGYEPPAYRVLRAVIADIRPKLHIINGDFLDFPSISRFLPLDLEEELPTVQQELDWAAAVLEDIRAASPRTRILWCMGNHDDRLAKFLIKHAPELKDLKTAPLKYHFNKIEQCRAVILNRACLVKHVFKMSLHAGYHNALHAGTSIATGHTHRLLARPITDLNGVRYGIETGFIGEVHGPQFLYCDNNPRSWQPGFAILHLNDMTVYPELVPVIGDKARFRGRYA